jgi:hypothetical protein
MRAVAFRGGRLQAAHRAFALFLVCVIGKLAMLNGRSMTISAWAPFAYFWQDAAVALGFAVVAALAVRHRRLAHATAPLYWLIAIYVAVNIPVGRVLATPLTRPMLRATGGPLADSLLLYLTWSNVALVTMTVAAAALLPRLLERLPARSRWVAGGCAIALVAAGPMASARVDTAGFDRNVVVAMVKSGLPQVDAAEGPPEGGHYVRDFRASRFETGRREGLSGLRGRAAGRNVVLVGLESTGAQYLEPYGGDAGVMPALTSLSRNAVVFDNAYAVYPESIKGLFSILCSTSPAFDTDAEDHGRRVCPSIAGQLAGAGYSTGMFHSGRFAYLGMESIVQNRGYGTLEDAGHIGGNHESSFGIDEPSTVARMLSWIDALPRDRPFFLNYLPIAGHHPYESPRHVFSNDTEFGRYRNALRYGDDSLAALIEGFRARGLDDNTLWVFYGDHGEAFGQHEGNVGHTFLLYDENVRVPFVVAAPGLTLNQTRVERVVSLLDIAPTVLDLLGLPVPARYQGRSMLDDMPRMALFFTDYSRPLGGLRDGDWKFVYELDGGRGRLFNIAADAHERTDLSTRHADRVEWYGNVLRTWSAAQKAHIVNGE